MFMHDNSIIGVRELIYVVFSISKVKLFLNLFMELFLIFNKDYG